MGNCICNGKEANEELQRQYGITIEIIYHENKIQQARNSMSYEEEEHIKTTQGQILSAAIRYNKQREEELQTQASRLSKRSSLFSVLSDIPQSILSKGKKTDMNRRYSNY